MKKNSFLNLVLSTLDPSQDNYSSTTLKLPSPHYLNIAFEGGGVKGIAYTGALEALNKSTYPSGTSYLTQAENVSGTSAGAITAMLVALGYTPDQIQALITPERIKSLKDPVGFFRIIFSAIDISKSTFWRNVGLNKGMLLQKFIEDRVAEKFGDKYFTFRQLHEMKKIDGRLKNLIITGANISTLDAELYSYQHTPDMPIATAVRISASLPLYYQSVKYKKQLRSDGGIYNNFPIDVFDLEEIQKNTDYHVKDPNVYAVNGNMQSLGLYFDSTSVRQKDQSADKSAIEQMGQIGLSVINNTRKQLLVKVYQKNSVGITPAVGGKLISPVDFDLPWSSKDILTHNGYIQTKRFLKRQSRHQLQKFATIEAKYKFLLESLYTQKKEDTIPLSIRIPDVLTIISFLLLRYQTSTPEQKSACLAEIRGLRAALCANVSSSGLTYEPYNLHDEDNFENLQLQIDDETFDAWTKDTKPSETSIFYSMEIKHNKLKELESELNELVGSTEEIKKMRMILQNQKEKTLHALEYSQLRTNIRNTMEEMRKILQKTEDIYIKISPNKLSDMMIGLTPAELIETFGKLKGAITSLLLLPFYGVSLSIFLSLKLLEGIINLTILIISKTLKALSSYLHFPIPEKLQLSLNIKSALKNLDKIIDAMDQFTSITKMQNHKQDCKTLTKLLKDEDTIIISKGNQIAREALIRAELMDECDEFVRLTPHIRKKITETIKHYKLALDTHNSPEKYKEKYEQNQEKIITELAQIHAKLSNAWNKQAYVSKHQLRFFKDVSKNPLTVEHSPYMQLGRKSTTDTLSARIETLRNKIIASQSITGKKNNHTLRNIFGQNPILFERCNATLNASDLGEQMLSSLNKVKEAMELSPQQNLNGTDACVHAP